MENLHVHLAQSVSLNSHLALSTYIRELALALGKQRGISLHIYPLGPVPKWLSEQGFEVTPVRGDLYTLVGQYRYFDSFLSELRQGLDGTRNEILHCIYPNSSLTAAVRVKRRLDYSVPVLYDVRSPWIEMAQERFRLLRPIGPAYRAAMYRFERHLAKNVDGWCFITRELQRWYHERVGLGHAHVTVIPSGVDVERFASAPAHDLRVMYEFPTDTVLVGYVGALTTSRRLELLPEAIHKLAEAGLNYSLLFVGDGNARPILEHQVQTLGLEKRIRFAGKVEPQQVPHFVAGFDVAASHLPDLFIFRTSFPLKLLEYRAAKKPVVASNIDCHRILREELNLYLYVWDDPADLARVILNASEATLPESDLSSYAWSAIAESFVSQYRQLCQ